LTPELRIALLQGDTALAEIQKAAKWAQSTFERMQQALALLPQQVPNWNRLDEDQRAGLVSDYLTQRALLSQQRTDWEDLTPAEQNDLILREMDIS
jgi:hypothetical protein